MSWPSGPQWGFHSWACGKQGYSHFKEPASALPSWARASLAKTPYHMHVGGFLAVGRPLSKGL